MQDLQTYPNILSFLLREFMIKTWQEIKKALTKILIPRYINSKKFFLSKKYEFYK